MKHRVVIIGGGFGGLEAAQSLKASSVAVTLIDRRNFHLFQPLLYQVATGGLSPANIASPLRGVLRKRDNVEVILGEVIDVDAAKRQVVLADARIDYDSLIVATGSRHYYFGHDEWESLAPGLKTVEDATRMRSRVLRAFEMAERADDPDEQARCLTFVVVGGGPTGVELAGALAELTRRTLQRNFRHIHPENANILLIEGEDRLVPMYPPKLSAAAQKSLERLGVVVKCNARVNQITPESVTIHVADDGDEVVPTRTVLWAAGVRASKLGKALADATGAELDRGGRVVVENDCTTAGHPEIFVIGDLAAHKDENGQPLPGLAQVAIQQGRYAAKVIQRRLLGETTDPFHYKNYGEMSTIGRASAVAQIGKWQFSGFLAWLAWLLVHLVQLVGFENRLLVLIQWAGNYLTRNRAARLITEAAPQPETHDAPKREAKQPTHSETDGRQVEEVAAK